MTCQPCQAIPCQHCDRAAKNCANPACDYCNNTRAGTVQAHLAFIRRPGPTPTERAR